MVEPDLPRADEEDPHERVAYSGSRRAYSVGYRGRVRLAPVARWRLSRSSPLASVSGSALGAESAFRQVGRRAWLRRAGAPHATRQASRDTVYVVEQRGRVIRLRARAARTGVPRHPQPRRATAASRVFSASRSTRATRSNRLFYVALHVRERPQHASARFRSNGTRAVPSSRETFSWPCRIRTGTTTAATSPSGRTGVSTRASATAVRAAIPRTARRTCSRSSGSCCASTSRSPARAGRSRRSGFAIPGASRSIARRATSTSAMSGQGAIEEVDFTPRSSPGLENYGWDVYEGSRRFEDKALGPGELVFPVSEYSHDRGCTVTGGFVYRGRRDRQSAAGTSSATTAAASSGASGSSSGEATDLRVEPFKVDEPQRPSARTPPASSSRLARRRRLPRDVTRV